MDQKTKDLCENLLKKARECGVDLNEWIDPSIMQIKARLTIHVPVTYHYSTGISGYMRDEQHGTAKIRMGLAYLRELLMIVRPYSLQQNLCDETERLLDQLEKQYLK